MVVMDGIGYRQETVGNAVAEAYTPHLDWLSSHCPVTLLRAHGTAVGHAFRRGHGQLRGGAQRHRRGAGLCPGAPAGQRGHRVRAPVRGKGWGRLIDFCRANGGTLHFIGLFSDGNVHSHIDHLKAMLTHAARKDRIPRARIHILLDGRDVGETSALDYVLPFEEFLRNSTLGAGVDYRIASGGGRMAITMDRYEANWDMVKPGWETHVAGDGGALRLGPGGHRNLSPGASRGHRPGPAAVRDRRDGGPVGRIVDGDRSFFSISAETGPSKSAAPSRMTISRSLTASPTPRSNTPA